MSNRWAIRIAKKNTVSIKIIYKMKTNSLFLILLGSILFNPSIQGQTSSKLQATNIIGSTYSVDYDNNNSLSTTVNTKKNAFDGNFDTFFASYDRSNTWVGLDLGEKYVITKVAYCPRHNWEQRVEMGVFEGANNPDFGDAVPLYLISEIPENDVLTEKNISNTRGFRYVRYVGPHDVRCNIAELEFYGYASEGDDFRLSQTTNIPDVIIHTTNAQDITTRSAYVKGIISFVSEDGTKIYTDSLDIKGRGNASWGFEKKPYRIKLYNKTKALGNPAEAKNWTLISNHGDKTLMRNLLAFDLSKRFRMPYTPAGRAVNVFLNGEYKGCYQFCDHIDVRKNRVDIKEMVSTDISGDKLTGGYLIEIDSYASGEKEWFKSSRQTPVAIKSPDEDIIGTEQRNYIKNHFNAFETAIFDPNYTDSVLGFRRYMDTETFVKHFLIGELSGNTDTYWSVNMYKQRRDDKFYFGPVWDFDLAFENDSRTYTINSKPDWIYKYGSAAGGTKSTISRLLTDSNLYNEIRTTWSNFRDWGIISDTSLLRTIDQYAEEMYAAQDLNFIRWKIRNKDVHMMWGRSDTYEGDVNIVKNYVKARITWIDNKLNYIPNPDNKNPYEDDNETSIENNDLSTIALWTTNNSINIRGIIEPTRIEVINYLGQILYKQTVDGNTSIAIEKGVYIVRLHNQKGETKVIKCIK
jgi:hypothetical protein